MSTAPWIPAGIPDDHNLFIPSKDLGGFLVFNDLFDLAHAKCINKIEHSIIVAITVPQAAPSNP